ncbi:MAG: polyhydroxyalkanoate synthase [Myxococcota bacterium]|jgi:polyhydroxyalkanoate synthase
MIPDPLAAVMSWTKEIDGLKQAEQARRGMWLHASLPRPPIGTTPHTVIHRQNKLTVRHYGPSTGTPVIVVPSMINGAAICDLEPDRSLVAGLALRGHAVYLIDWGTPGPEDAEQTVAFTLTTLLHRAIDRACRHARSKTAFLLGYCQGGTLATMYTALRPARIAGLAVFNAPVKFSEAGRFARLVDPAVFDVNAAIPADRLMSTDVMKVAFKLLDPMGNFTKYLALEQIAQRPAALSRALARERWLEENVPMPGAFAQEFIRCAYQEDRLLAGTWTVDGTTIDLSTITAPLLVCAAARDFIAPAPSVLPLADAVGSTDVTAKTLDTGHIGLIVGSFGPRVFYPLLSEWFGARQ